MMKKAMLLGNIGKLKLMMILIHMIEAKVMAILKRFSKTQEMPSLVQ